MALKMDNMKIRVANHVSRGAQRVKVAWKALACAGLIFGSQAALCGPVVFSFDGVLSSNVDVNAYGVALSDPFQVNVRVNNGSTDLANATWEFADTCCFPFSGDLSSR